MKARGERELGHAYVVPAQRELTRKLLHLGSVALPLFAWFASPTIARVVIVGGAVAAVSIEVLRLRVRGVRHLFLRRTRHLLRRHERRRLTGATYLAGSFAVAILVFPTPIAVLAMLYSGAADAAAAIVGRSFGAHRLRFNGKSMEGTTTCAVVALLIGLAVPGIPLLAAAAGAVAAAALELASLPPDDNVWVTLGGGFVVWAVAGLAG